MILEEMSSFYVACFLCVKLHKNTTYSIGMVEMAYIMFYHGCCNTA